MNTTNAAFTPPEWAFEFHGHYCPFMPLGYRMGKLAMQRLEVEHEKDHGFYVFPELGEGHPQTCLIDGIQVATGAMPSGVMAMRRVPVDALDNPGRPGVAILRTEAACHRFTLCRHRHGQRGLPCRRLSPPARCPALSGCASAPAIHRHGGGRPARAHA